MNTFILVLVVAISLSVLSELHYKLMQWMNKSSEVFEIEH